MMKNSALIYLLGLALGAVLLPLQAAETPRPNIVFFFIDDLGYRDLGCSGNEVFQTPNIDALCESGLKFTGAYVAAAVCSPSRAAALTGRHCLELGLWNAAHRVKPGTLIYPKLLSESGYQTWHIGKWHMGLKRGKTSPVDLGFDVGIAGDQSFDPGSHFYPYRNAEMPDNKGLDVPDLRKDGNEGEYLADRLTDEAVKLIDQRDPNKPFYLNFWHYGVHSPHEAKADKIEKYEKLFRQMKRLPPRVDPVSGTHYAQTPVSPVYAAMVESIDDSVGRVVAHLKTEGLYENTLIVFYSDNGPVGSATVKPLRGYKNSLYEGGVRVPAIFSWPGRIKPGVSEARIWTLDLFRTMLGLAEVDVPADYVGNEGMSLVPHLLTGSKVPGREFYWYFPEDRLGWGQRASAAVLDESDMKYHLFFGEYEPELYDLNKEQAESNNLAVQFPEKAQQLDRRLKARMRALYPGLPKPIGKYECMIPRVEELVGLDGKN
jgi:arylsulfatase A